MDRQINFEFNCIIFNDETAEVKADRIMQMFGILHLTEARLKTLTEDVAEMKFDLGHLEVSIATHEPKEQKWKEMEDNLQLLSDEEEGDAKAGPEE